MPTEIFCFSASEDNEAPVELFLDLKFLSKKGLLFSNSIIYTGDSLRYQRIDGEVSEMANSTNLFLRVFNGGSYSKFVLGYKPVIGIGASHCEETVSFFDKWSAILK